MLQWGNCQLAVISLDTLGEEDTESMIMLEPTEDQGPDDGRSMVIIGPQGPPGPESPAVQIPKRSPPSYNTHGGLRKRRRGAGSQPKPLPNKPQDIQVAVPCDVMAHDGCCDIFTLVIVFIHMGTCVSCSVLKEYFIKQF